MRFCWWSLFALALAACYMDSSSNVSAVQQLPAPWQVGLEDYHAKLAYSGKAYADDAWSMDEHAQILLQYMRPGAKKFLKDVRIEKRSAKAITHQ